MTKSYAQHVEPFIQDARRIFVPEKDVKRIQDFAVALAEAKSRESNHMSDGDASISRKVTGAMGERALEILFGVEFMDWTISPGNSAIHHRPDLWKLGLNAGVKTVRWMPAGEFQKQDRFHTIAPRERWPEVMCFQQKTVVTVCGLATVDTLRKYTDIDLIENAKLKASGRKTGFWGFHEVKPFKTLAELRGLL